MTTKLMYFRSLDKREAALAFAELERIAKDLGYVTMAGPDTGHGNIAALLIAIAAGEVTLQKRGNQ